MNTRSVEDLILDGTCEGCDQDPAECYNRDYCIYEKETQNEITEADRCTKRNREG